MLIIINILIHYLLVLVLEISILVMKTTLQTTVSFIAY